MQASLKRALAQRKINAHAGLAIGGRLRRAIHPPASEAAGVGHRPSSSRASSAAPNFPHSEHVSAGQTLAQLAPASQLRKDSRPLRRLSLKISSKTKQARIPMVTGDRLRKARAAFQGDLLRASSRASVKSRLRTIQAIGESQFGARFSLVPITWSHVEGICAVLKEAGYLSADRYLSVWKLEHELDPKSEPLGVSFGVRFKRALRSLKAGQPKRRKAATFDLASTVAAAIACGVTDSPIVRRGPCQPLASLQLEVSFALREVEAGQATHDFLFTNPMLRQVTLFVPAQKAEGAPSEVTLGCCTPDCARLCCASLSCPFCTAYRKRVFNEDLFRRLGVDQSCWASMPLFPDEYGRPVSKVVRIDSLRKLLGFSGVPLVDPMLRQRFTGHSPRRSSLRLMSSLRASIPETMAVTRHTSAVVAEYFEEASAEGTASLAARSSHLLSHFGVVPLTEAKLPALLPSQWRSCDHWGIQAFAANGNPTSTRVHAVLPGELCKSKCGFKHSGNPWVSMCKVLPEFWSKPQLCSMCFRGAK